MEETYFRIYKCYSCNTVFLVESEKVNGDVVVGCPVCPDEIAVLCGGKNIDI